MTSSEIDELIAKRDRIAIRYSYRVNQLDQIDRKLSQVPAGVDNRVDQALGRACAVLPKRPDYGISVTQADTISMIEMTRAIFEQAEPIEY